MDVTLSISRTYIILIQGGGGEGVFQSVNINHKSEKLKFHFFYLTGGNKQERFLVAFLLNEHCIIQTMNIDGKYTLCSFTVKFFPFSTISKM